MGTHGWLFLPPIFPPTFLFVSSFLSHCVSFKQISGLWRVPFYVFSLIVLILDSSSPPPPLFLMDLSNVRTQQERIGC